MTHIVTEKCLKCKYTDCVEVCPVDCFHEGDEYLVIDPDVCIDCGVCVPECPIEAIVNDETYVDGMSVEQILSAEDGELLTYKQRNIKTMAEFNKDKAVSDPLITVRKDPLPEAEEWSKVDDKINLIIDLNQANSD